MVEGEASLVVVIGEDEISATYIVQVDKVANVPEASQRYEKLLSARFLLSNINHESVRSL